VYPCPFRHWNSLLDTAFDTSTPVAHKAPAMNDNNTQNAKNAHEYFGYEIILLISSWNTANHPDYSYKFDASLIFKSETEFTPDSFILAKTLQPS